MSHKALWRSVGKVALAFGVFAGGHSLLASRRAKQLSQQLLGAERGGRWYRLFFNAQAVVSTGALFLFILKQPDREVYKVQGPLRWVMFLGQLASLLFGALAVKEYGLKRFAGTTDVAAKNEATTQAQIPRESQGPTADESGNLLTGGVFQYSRHPLNVAPFFFFWLMPKMTRNVLICNVLGTIYLLAGSWHEEKRLQAAFGQQYEEYQRSGVPFFLPRFWK